MPWQVFDQDKFDKGPSVNEPHIDQNPAGVMSAPTGNLDKMAAMLGGGWEKHWGEMKRFLSPEQLIQASAKVKTPQDMQMLLSSLEKDAAAQPLNIPPAGIRKFGEWLVQRKKME